MPFLGGFFLTGESRIFQLAMYSIAKSTQPHKTFGKDKRIQSMGGGKKNSHGLAGFAAEIMEDRGITFSIRQNTGISSVSRED